jgi:hypothetical protein
MSANAIVITTDFINEFVNNEIILTKTKKTYVGSVLIKLESFNDKDELHKLNAPAIINYDNNGKKISKYWYKNGKLHRDEDKYAYAEYDNSGWHKVQKWYKDGKIHRDGDLPAQIVYNKDDKITKTWYKDDEIFRDNNLAPIIDYDFGYVYMKTWCNKDGTIHRDGDLPAREYYSSYNEILMAKTWYKNGNIHRDGDLPAYERYDLDNIENYHTRIWYKDGNIHRDRDLPAYEKYSPFSKKLQSQTWYKNGNIHRDGDLPAEKTYYDGETLYSETWYKEGKKYRNGDKPCYIKYNRDSVVEVKECHDNIDISLSNEPAITKEHYYPNDELAENPIINNDDLIEKIKKFSTTDIIKCLEILDIINK